MKKRLSSLILLAFLAAIRPLEAAPKTQSALSLLEPSGARAAALAESYSAIDNDVTGMAYNPSSLATLDRGAVSLLYQSGLANDRYGQVVSGIPISPRGRVGIQFGYYATEKINVFDGNNERSVVGQNDWLVGVGYGGRFGPLSLGFTSKYYRTEVAESSSAQAWMGDVGGGFNLGRRLRLGAAVQNVGTRLRYQSRSEDLPRISRVGLALSLPGSTFQTTLLGDLLYLNDVKETHPVGGVEFRYGVMALRAGLRTGAGDEQFSIGTGFSIGDWVLDYAFGFADQLDSPHRISLSTFFGAAPAPILVSAPKPKSTVVEIPERNFKAPPGGAPFHPVALQGQEPRPRVYIVKEGESLRSIAKHYYGREELVTLLINANRPLGLDEKNVKPGMSILIPKGFGE